MPRSLSKHQLGLIALFAFALLVRLLFLGKTLDADEMSSAAWALAKSPDSLFQQLYYPIEGNAAGYPALIFLWGKLGRSEIWLRLPSALAGAATAALFFWYYSRRFSPLSAFLGALLWSPSMAALEQGQSARCYSLFGLLCFLSLISAAKARAAEEGDQLLWTLAFALCATGSLLLHHFGFFYLAPLAAILIFDRLSQRKASQAFLIPILILLLYSTQLPLLLFQLQNGPRWIPALSLPVFFTSLRELLWLHSWPATVIGIGAMAAGVAGNHRKLRLELAFALFPLAAAVFFSLSVREIFQARYLFPSTLGLFALAAGGFSAAEQVNPKMGRFAAFLGVCAASFAALQLPSYYSVPKSADWRGAAQFILDKQNECSNLVVTNPYWLVRWPYYLGNGFVLRHWNEGYPKTPFWLAGAGHPPLPANIKAIGEQLAMIRWQGQDALAYCIRPEG